MGDRSPKSNKKLASQKNDKTARSDKVKKDEIARGQLTKAKAAATAKK